MNDLQKNVARLRAGIEEQRKVLQEAWGAVTDTQQYQTWLACQEYDKMLKEQEAAAKQTLGEAALYVREKDGDGSLPGVTIKQTRVVEYDAVAATNWCHTYAPALLSLDPKRFEPAVRDGLVICPIAQVRVVLKPYVDSDLSRFLEE